MQRVNDSVQVAPCVHETSFLFFCGRNPLLARTYKELHLRRSPCTAELQLEEETEYAFSEDLSVVLWLPNTTTATITTKITMKKKLDLGKFLHQNCETGCPEKWLSHHSWRY